MKNFVEKSIKILLISIINFASTTACCQSSDTDRIHRNNLALLDCNEIQDSLNTYKQAYYEQSISYDDLLNAQQSCEKQLLLLGSNNDLCETSKDMCFNKLAKSESDKQKAEKKARNNGILATFGWAVAAISIGILVIVL